MPSLSAAVEAGAPRVDRFARQSQALVIALMDCVARNRDGRIRTLGRLARVNLDVAHLVIGEPHSAVDSVYDHVMRMVALHREFVHCMFETIDAHGDQDEQSGPVGNVIPLTQSLGSRSG